VNSDLGNRWVLGGVGLVACGKGIMRNKKRHAIVYAFPLLLPHAPQNLFSPLSALPTGLRMDTTTRAKYSKLSEEKWRRVIAVLAASCVIQELCLGLATCGSLPVQWHVRAVDVFQACEANPQAYPQPKGYKTWTARRKDIGQFIEKWWNRFGATGSTLDVPRPGRLRTVPDATLATLITHIKFTTPTARCTKTTHPFNASSCPTKSAPSPCGAPYNIMSLPWRRTTR
jgi:hypothetical protein